jgi:hypothetical protein
MAFQRECEKIQEFVDQVEELLDELEGQDIVSEYFASTIERVKDAKNAAESNLYDIEYGEDNDADIETAQREAQRVKNKLEGAIIDIDDCLTALGE